MAHRSILAQVTPEAAAKAPARRTHKARALDSGVARGPRLSLAAIDAPVPQGLRVTSTLAEPEGDAARRAAAALLWQAINADPQEILRTGAMLQSLEHELAQLQQNATQTHQEIAALRQRIDHAQPWYASATLLKLLALLVAAAATAAGVVWYRTRKLRGLGEAWYMPHQGHDAAPPEELVREDVSPRARPLPALAEGQAFVPPNVGVSDAPVRVSPLEAEKSVTVDFDLLDAQESKSEPPQRSADSARRVETLAATFGEVDFLVSLGLTQDAMDVLKAYVQDSDKPAPLAYLELMRLSEEAADPVAVATVRRRYARAFRVEAPRLPQITADLGVDSVPDLSARLTRTWNSGDRLAMLEQVLLSVPTPAAPISVRAARELLSLHQLAQCMAAEEAGAGADEVPLAPWAHAVDAHEAHAAAVDAADAQGGAQFGLDVDLSDKAADAAEVSTSEAAQSQLAPFLEEIQAASRHEAARRQQEEEDAFSAAVASERIPVSRY